MLLVFSRERNGLGVSVLFMPKKWLHVPPEGVYVSKYVI
jgi:hypothetical protein